VKGIERYTPASERADRFPHGHRQRDRRCLEQPVCGLESSKGGVGGEGAAREGAEGGREMARCHGRWRELYGNCERRRREIEVVRDEWVLLLLLLLLLLLVGGRWVCGGEAVELRCGICRF